MLVSQHHEPLSVQPCYCFLLALHQNLILQRWKLAGREGWRNRACPGAVWGIRSFWHPPAIATVCSEISALFKPFVHQPCDAIRQEEKHFQTWAIMDVEHKTGKRFEEHCSTPPRSVPGDLLRDLPEGATSTTEPFPQQSPGCCSPAAACSLLAINCNVI